MTAASKARSVVPVVVTVLAIANVAMIAMSPSWRHGAGGVASFLLAVALIAAVVVLARSLRGGRG
jgi:hypothetical protein